MISTVGVTDESKIGDTKGGRSLPIVIMAPGGRSKPVKKLFRSVTLKLFRDVH